ncbi:MAG: ABC-ATPase domain-containing protein [Myxococcota bacterium]
MSDTSRLRALLQRIDGRPYPAYRDIKGVWNLGAVEIRIDHVQGDPFAAPSRVRVRIQTSIAEEICSDPVQRLAAEDWLLRRFGADLTGTRRGSGKSGLLDVYRPGPEIVERSAVRLLSDGVAEVRLRAGLPARGRRILGEQAWRMLSADLPAAATALVAPSEPSLHEQIASVRLQQRMRAALRAQGLVAFIADGSVLPRSSGVSQAPMAGAVPFSSPASLRVNLCGVEGMGVPTGLTLIVGGGFHGKSTVLQAIQRGHLDHIPGDGREQVVADPDTVKVRAEDGRSVVGVDVSPFLGALPGGRSTAPFSTPDASGSTSQAAAIVEAVEAGAKVLLLDEDTSATNLLVRDERMRRLIPPEREPITPFVERVREIREQWGVSTIMVVGGVGDYLAVADTIIGMNAYRAQDLTEAGQALAGEAARARRPLGKGLAIRGIEARSLKPTGKGRIGARDDRRISYGLEEIDLTAVEQVLDGAHAATIGHAIRWLFEQERGFAEVDYLLDVLESAIGVEGIEILSPFREPVGALICPRRHEVAAAINRLRTLSVR